MLRTFIQISALVVTLLAAFFLAKGSLALSPRMIGELAAMKVGYNPDLIASLAHQRADTWAGSFLLLVAFALQLGNNLWPMRFDDFSVHRGAAAYAVVFWIVVGAGVFYGAREYAQRSAAEAREILDAAQAPKP